MIIQTSLAGYVKKSAHVHSLKEHRSRSWTNRGTLTPQGLEKSTGWWLYQTLSIPEPSMRICLRSYMRDIPQSSTVQAWFVRLACPWDMHTRRRCSLVMLTSMGKWWLKKHIIICGGEGCIVWWARKASMRTYIKFVRALENLGAMVLVSRSTSRPSSNFKQVPNKITPLTHLDPENVSEWQMRAALFCQCNTIRFL